MTEQPRQNGRGGSRLDSTRQGGSDNRKKKKKEKIIMVVMIVLAVIMVLAAAAAVLYSRWVRKPSLPSAGDEPSISADAPTAGLPGGPDVSGEDLDLDSVQPKVSGERKSKDYYTVLVFGADESSGLTDSIMLVSYDVTNQKATVMSIPRDTLVNVRSSYKSINGVYKLNGRGEKGTKALKNEVSDLVGFTPDYYVMIDWSIVGRMVDAIGGVYFDVPWDMWYSDPYQDLYIDLKEGYQLLDGDKAMQLVRWRKNMDPKTYKILSDHSSGDVGRLKIQQDFLKAVLKQTLQLKNVTKIGQLAQLFGENVTSDLSIENLFWFGSQAIMGGLNADNVTFTTMPYYGGGYGEYTAKVYPNRKALLTLINESLNPFVEEVTMKELDLISVNKDGTLSASSGKLADPSAAIPKPSESPSAEPGEDDEPVISPEPGESGDPAVSPDPSVSGDPTISPDPAVSQDPAPSGDPAETGTPEPTPDPIETMPDWLRPDTGTETP